MLLKEFNDEFEDLLGQFLWSQWSALGIRSGVRKTAKNIVDPESLLLLTWGPGRNDPRLFDTALAWMLEYGDLIDASRLKRLLSSSDQRIQSVSQGWGNYLISQGRFEWKRISHNTHPRDTLSTLFSSTSVMLDARDEAFEIAGWARGKVSLQTGAIGEQCPNNTPAARLTLRRLFGVNGRAEILGSILFGEQLTTSEIASATAYSTRYIQSIARDFEAVGLAISTLAPGRQGTLSPTPKALKLRDILFQDEPVPWIDMVSITNSLLALWSALEEIKERSLREYSSESLLRDALRDIQKKTATAQFIKDLPQEEDEAHNLKEILNKALKITGYLLDPSV